MSRTNSVTSRSSRPSTNKPGSPTPLKRLTHEITDLRENPNPAVLHLGPSTDSDLFTWEAVLKGPPSPSPYSGGLWLLNIKIPQTYPMSPPQIRFATPICHANIHFDTGEICLSLLSGEHWSPSYTLSSTMSAIQQLLSDPGLDSPLNVDAGNLMREGDELGMESLVRFWTSERRWQGEGEAGWISERNDNWGGGGRSTAGHLDPRRQNVHEREVDGGVMAEKGGRDDVVPESSRRRKGSRAEKEEGDARTSRSSVGRESNGSKDSRSNGRRDETGLDARGIPKRTETGTK